MDFPNYKVIEVITGDGRVYIEIQQSAHPDCVYYITEEYTEKGQVYKRKICDI